MTRYSIEAIQSLIDEIILTPTEDGYGISLQGELGGILVTRHLGLT